MQPFGTGMEWAERVGALLLLSLLNAFFWGVWYLQFNIMTLWADKNTERVVPFHPTSVSHIALFQHHISLYTPEVIPTTWFQAINGIFIFALTPVVTTLWARQAARGREPNSAAKMGIGGILLGLSFLFMLAAGRQPGR